MQEEFFPYIEGHEEALADLFITHAYRKVSVPKGAEIEVPPPKNIAYLMKGRLKIYMINDLGDERLMWFLEAKSIISNLLINTFAKRIIAQEDCEVYYMHISYYNAYTIQSIEHFRAFTDTFYHRYGLLVQQLLNAESENARMKVYKFIYQLAIRYGKQTNGIIKIESFPSRNDISSITGIHRSNVTRYITELEKMGIVKKEKLQLSITDIDALRKEIQALENSD